MISLPHPIIITSLNFLVDLQGRLRAVEMDSLGMTLAFTLEYEAPISRAQSGQCILLDL
jgi:hypothetical protein